MKPLMCITKTYSFITTYLLLASPYKLNHLKERECTEFFPELLVTCGM